MQTNSTGALSRLPGGTEVFLAAAEAATGLRIFTPYQAGEDNKGPGMTRGLCRSHITVAYFSEVLIEVNLLFRLVPRPLTTAMIASEMPAAIRPYSIAVAPDSSFTKRASRFFITQLHVHVAVELRFGRAGVLSTVTMADPRVRQLLRS